MTDSTFSARYERRARLRAAVFGDQDDAPAARGTVLTGVLTEVETDAIVVVSADDEEQALAIAPTTVTWLGAQTTHTALRPGDTVIVRMRAQHASAAAGVVERIWARIGRVTGTIIAGGGREFLVDAGRPGHAPEQVVLAGASFRQILVRFPRLAPGYLIDVIGTRHDDYLLGVIPATAQPPYRAGQPPVPPRDGRIADPVSGTAVWHEPGDQPPDLRGLGYPAIDPESQEQAASPAPASPAPASPTPGCVRLPYLSLGSSVRLRNECTGDSAVLPVTSGGENSWQFCDRCVKCGTSPRGRIADLTVAAFVELGGNLEDGCFNATLTLPD